MITQCSICQVNTVGQHEWNCPMNSNSVEVMKVRNADYLEWHNKIQELKKENADLKSKLASIKTLARWEVLTLYDEFITDICNLAITERDKCQL